MPASMLSQTQPPASNETAFHFPRDHRAEAFRTMNEMRQSRELCDVTLVVDGNKIHAHRVVMAATSPYFHAMFTNDLAEKNSAHVTLHELDPVAMRTLVDYAYTSYIKISEDNVQVTNVRDACCKFLMKQLHPSNCLGIRTFADTHSCEDLWRLAQQFCLHNFIDVCDTEEFLLLSFADIKDLISSEELNIVNEEQVFQSVIKWVKHDLCERQAHVAELLSFVRLPLTSRDFLMDHVDTEPVIKNNPACKDLLIEAMKYHLMPEQRITLHSERTRERRCTGSRPHIFAIGGGSLFAIHTECEVYDRLTDQWTPIAPMSQRRSRCGVTVARGKLYAIGGYDGAHDLSTAECYNPRVNRWFKVTSMGIKRSCLGLCVFNGLLYAVGGYDGASCLNSVERYDPLTLMWTSVSAMNLRRRYLKLAVFEGCIFAIGGYDGSSHMSSVEKFDPLSNKWITCPNMISRRSNSGIAVLDGMIYVCGGNDGTSCLSTVERFNPKRNLWEAVPPMHSRRSTHEVVALEECLYAVGGNDGSTSLNNVERFDPKTNKWVLVAPMNLRRSSVGVCVMEIMKRKKTYSVSSPTS